MNWWQMGQSLQALRRQQRHGRGMRLGVFADGRDVPRAIIGSPRLTDGVATVAALREARPRCTRIIRKPNDYQSMSDLLLNVTRRTYEKGEAFGLAMRNDSNEIAEIHWMRNGHPFMVAEDGSIFYGLRGNEIIERRFDLVVPIPARDVLHIRLHTPMHPLKGISPILAATLDLALSGAALSQQVMFYLNGARPSASCWRRTRSSTKTEADDLRQRWDAQTRGDNAGGTPILSWGFKAKEIRSAPATASWPTC
jgi:phage portal protein BeeE